MSAEAYEPDWAKDVTDDELFGELKRRRDYYMRGWQESYASAQFWRRRAERVKGLVSALDRDRLNALALELPSSVWIDAIEPILIALADFQKGDQSDA